jgi:hypothetical protein
MIAQDIVREALEEIGAYSPFEQQGGSDFDLGLRRLNSMIDLWKLEQLMIDHWVRSTVTLTASVASFLIATGATWNIARPDFIAAANYVDASGNESPLAIFDDEEWAMVSNKALTSTRPTGIRYEKTMTAPLGAGTIYPWPIATENGTIALYVPTPLNDVASLSTTIYLAPGYREALFYNLALRLAPSFGKTVSQDTRDFARNGRARIQSANSRPQRISLHQISMTSEGNRGIDPIDFRSRNF